MESLNLDHSSLIKGYHIPNELCDDILKEQQGKKKLLYQEAKRKNIKGYDKILLHQLSYDLLNRYVTELEKCKQDYIKQYPILKTVPNITIEHVDNIPYINLQKYAPGSSYNVEHCENDTHPLFRTRIMVFMTYLNDIQEDGGTHFPYQNFTAKPTKGLTLIWPAYFTHTHIGVPAPKEVKYILTGWFRVYDDDRTI